MKYSFFVDFYFFISMEMAERTCVREAIHYKRNKKQFKTFINSIHPVRRIFRLYLPRETYAPNHMRYFQLFRAINVAVLIANGIFALFEKNTICGYLLCSKVVLLYIPSILYDIYALLKSPAGKQNIDFSVFKKP